MSNQGGIQGQRNAPAGDSQQGALSDWLVSSVKRLHMTGTDSVQKWLEDLRLMTETECMCVLQGKSLSKDAGEPKISQSKTIKETIDAIKSRAHIASSEFAKVFKKLDKERWKHVKTGAVRLTQHIRSLIHECNSSVYEPPQFLYEEEELVLEHCANLVEYVESININGYMSSHKLPVADILTSLGQSFSNMVDIALGHFILVLIETVDNPRSPFDVSEAIGSLINLGMEGEHMCYVITREGGVRTLFNLCRTETLELNCAQALRAIATICCVPESVMELEQANGMECLTEILSSPALSEMVRSEAAGVIAQITSPSLDHYHHVTGFLENMDDLIRSLTVLCEEATTHEVFLLATAAMANITFVDSLACDFLLQYNTAAILVQACQMNKAQSPFAKDQVATILANMANLDNCWNEITDNSGVELLLHFLQERPQLYESEAEGGACERVQQKAAIALTRLSRDHDNAQIIVELQGIPRLIMLCKNTHERNSSDAVLVACLTCLRKLAESTGNRGFSNQDVRQLIAPRLLDSFLMCSQMEESFV